MDLALYRRITIRSFATFTPLQTWRSVDRWVHPSIPNFLPEESAIGESIRILLKRKWVVISVLATIF